MRSAVNHHDQRILRIRCETERLRQERLDVSTVEALERKCLNGCDSAARQELLVVRCELLNRAGLRADRLDEQLRRPARLRHRVGNAILARERPRAHRSDVRRDQLRVAGQTLTVQPRAASLLDRQIHGLPVSRPFGRSLTVVDAAQLTPSASVGIHHPHVRILHRRLRRCEGACGGLEGNRSAVGRPLRAILGALRVAQSANGAIRDLQREDVVVEEAIRIGSPVRDEENLFPFRRPVERMLVVVAGRQLADLLRCDLDGEDVQPAVVVEAGEAFGRGWLVEIAGDDHRVAVGVGLGTLGGRDERDLTAVGRPGQPVA